MLSFTLNLSPLLLIASVLNYSWCMPTNTTHDSALTLSSRTVYNPHITNPHDGTIWTIGDEVDVTWDTSDIRRDSNPKGKVVLGYMDGHSTSEHLDNENPLAEGFEIAKGHVQVTVPSVNKGSNYIIVLFGDSGNKSPQFTIN